MPLAPNGPQGALLCSCRPERRRPCPPPASRSPDLEASEMEGVGQGAHLADPASTGDVRWKTLSWT
jgi:hypothetical protein